MDCQNIQEYFYQYLDRELDAQHVKEVEIHLEKCPLCQMQLEREQKFNSIIKNHLLREEAPFDLREKVVAALEHPQGFSGWLNRLFPKQLALTPAFAVIIGIITFTVIVSSQKTPPMYTAAVQNHIDYLRGGYPLEIRTSNVDEAVSWFQGKMDFAVGEPHIDRDQANLVGARLVNINDKKSAYFVYEKDGYNISAFNVDLNGVKLPKVSVADTQETPKAKVYYKAYKGYQSFLCLSKEEDTGCIIVSDMPKHQLEHILHQYVH